MPVRCESSAPTRCWRLSLASRSRARSIGCSFEHISGERMSLQRWLFDTVSSLLGDGRLASLLLSLVWIFVCYAMLALLYRKNIVWKV